MSEEDLTGYFGEEFSDGTRTSYLKTLRPQDNAAIEVGVLTQMGDARSNPDGWREFHALHWGYTVPNSKDPSKPIRIRFYCNRKMGKNRMIVKDCPMCIKRDAEFEAKEAYVAKLKLENKSEEEIKTLTASSNSWLRTFNRDGKWYMYGFTGSEFVRLLLSHKTFQDLEAEMNKAQTELQLNPRSPKNLLMWKITRIGAGKQGGKMSEKVERMVEAVTINSRTLFDVKKIKLTDDQMRNAVNSYVSLKEADAYRLTDEQIQQLVDCDEDPETVAKIVGAKPEPKAATPAEQPASAAKPPTSAAKPPTSAAKPPASETKPAPTPEALLPGSEMDDEEAALVKALEAARAKKASKVGQSVPATEAEPKHAANKLNDMNDMSDAELFAELGLDSDDLAGHTASK